MIYIVKNIRILGIRLETSDCTGKLPLNVVGLRILVGLDRAIRRQIGNTGLGGCTRRPLENITTFKFCLFSAALNRGNSAFRNKFDY